MPQPSSWLVLVLLVTERFHSGPPEHSSGNGLICLYTHTHRLTLTHIGHKLKAVPLCYGAALAQEIAPLTLRLLSMCVL